MRACQPIRDGYVERAGGTPTRGPGRFGGVWLTLWDGGHLGGVSGAMGW